MALGLGPNSASASATFYDFVITCTNGSLCAGATQVSGSVNFDVSGTFETTASDTGELTGEDHGGNSYMYVGVNGSVDGAAFSGVFTQSASDSQNSPPDESDSASGVFAGDSVPTGFTTGLATLPVGAAFEVSLGISEDSGAGYNGSNTGVGGGTRAFQWTWRAPVPSLYRLILQALYSISRTAIQLILSAQTS